MKYRINRGQDGFAHLLLILIVVGALMVGAGVYVYGQQRQAGTLSSASNDDSTSKASLTGPLPADLLPASKVRELAQADKPGQQIRQIELEHEDGVLLYKVQLADGSFLLYNARSGVKVSKQVRQAAEVEKDANLPADFTAAISFDRAREIALGQKPGGQIRKIELETEHGVVVYSVRFTDGGRVDVDASSGAVVRTKAGKAVQPSGGSSGSGSSGSSGSSSPDDSNKQDDDSHDDDGSGSNSGSGSSNSGSGSGSDDDN